MIGSGFVIIFLGVNIVKVIGCGVVGIMIVIGGNMVVGSFIVILV